MYLPSVLGIAAAVTLDTGVWTGLQTSQSGVLVSKYLGIPYAAPPTRFVPAKSPTTTTSQKNADKLPPSCPTIGAPTESEDCLYLNVFAPASVKGKTVMVYLSGEGRAGASSEAYDGTSFVANQDVVLVVPNYRKSIFGFPGQVPGVVPRERNLGLLDQTMALDWVQKNIERFGGDPTKVTIFGESLEGSSVGNHVLVANTSSPRFRAAIMQSGTTHIKTPIMAMMPGFKAAVEPPFLKLAKQLGCSGADVLDCVRKHPASHIINALKSLALTFPPVEDDNFTVVGTGERLRQEHRVANIPVLLGTDAEEMKIEPKFRNMTLDDYLNKNFPPFLKHHILMAYAPASNSSYKTDFDAIAGIETDMHYTCVVGRESRSSSAAGYPTWRYLFNASFPQSALAPDSGAYHGSEIRYIFGNLPISSTPQELSLSKTIQTAWAQFAKDPASGPGWDRVGVAGGNDLGVFSSDGKLKAESPKFTDRWCIHWDMTSGSGRPKVR